METKLQQQSPQNAQTNRANLTGIPTQMKLDFERRSGLSFDDVRVHYNSDKPAQLQALAYTQGTQVYMGPGQERHLRHELGHVIQQKRGLVSTNILYYGHTSVNIDPRLEQQADELSKVSADDQKRDISSPLGIHRPIIQFELDDYFSDERQRVANILLQLSKTAEDSCPKIRDCVLEILKENESAAMLYAWDKSLGADLFMKKIEEQMREIKTKVLSDNSVSKYYEEKVSGILSMDKEAWVIVEIDRLIEDLKNGVNDYKSQFTSQDTSAREVYRQSFNNEYESIRGKELKGEQKKIFLRRLSRTGPSPSDKSANEKIQQSTNKAPTNIQQPFLRAKVWSPIINDAFVGGAIDSRSRFDIRDLSEELQEELVNLTSLDLSPANRAEEFLQKICKQHKEVYDEHAKFKYTVLSREIAQLLYHGWIFRIIKIGAKRTLQAFQSIEAYESYLIDKINSFPPYPQG